MKHVAMIDEPGTVTPVKPVNFSARKHRRETASLARAKGRLTRSTMSIPAADLLALEDRQIIEVITSSIRLCRKLSRSEILIENLEVLCDESKNMTIVDVVNALQSKANEACRNCFLVPPRVGLERRRGSYHLRVYVLLS